MALFCKPPIAAHLPVKDLGRDQRSRSETTLRTVESTRLTARVFFIFVMFPDARPIYGNLRNLSITVENITLVGSVFRTLLLATQTRDSIYYSSPGIFLDFAREFSLIS